MIVVWLLYPIWIELFAFSEQQCLRLWYCDCLSAAVTSNLCKIIPPFLNNLPFQRQCSTIIFCGTTTNKLPWCQLLEGHKSFKVPPKKLWKQKAWLVIMPCHLKQNADMEIKISNLLCFHFNPWLKPVMDCCCLGCEDNEHDYNQVQITSDEPRIVPPPTVNTVPSSDMPFHIIMWQHDSD